MTQVATDLKKTRSHLGLTQQKDAQQVGVDSHSWQDNEGGKIISGVGVLQGLERLGININWVLSGEGGIQSYQVNPSPAMSETDLKSLPLSVEMVYRDLKVIDHPMVASKYTKLTYAIANILMRKQ